MGRHAINFLLMLPLLACAAVAALWVRSYFAADLLSRSGPASAAIWSDRGDVGLLTAWDPTYPIQRISPGRRPGWKFSPGAGWTVPHAPASGLRREYRLGLLYRAVGPAWLADSHSWDNSSKTLLVVPDWMTLIVLAFLARVGILLIRRGNARRRRRSGLCIRCGYDLRASPGSCPECGTPAAALPPSRPAGRALAAWWARNAAPNLSLALCSVSLALCASSIILWVVSFRQPVSLDVFQGFHDTRTDAGEGYASLAWGRGGVQAQCTRRDTRFLSRFLGVEPERMNIAKLRDAGSGLYAPALAIGYYDPARLATAWRGSGFAFAHEHDTWPVPEEWYTPRPLAIGQWVSFTRVAGALPHWFATLLFAMPPAAWLWRNRRRIPSANAVEPAAIRDGENAGRFRLFKYAAILLFALGTAFGSSRVPARASPSRLISAPPKIVRPPNPGGAKLGSPGWLIRPGDDLSVTYVNFQGHQETSKWSTQVGEDGSVAVQYSVQVPNAAGLTPDELAERIHKEVGEKFRISHDFTVKVRITAQFGTEEF